MPIPLAVLSSPNKKKAIEQLAFSLAFSTLRLDGILYLGHDRLQLLLHLLALGLGLVLCVVEAAPVHQHSRRLGGAGEEEEEVYGCKEDIPRADDEAPAGPDETGGHESGVGVEGELGGGAGKVRCAGNNEAPFHDGSPAGSVSISSGTLWRWCCGCESKLERRVCRVSGTDPKTCSVQAVQVVQGELPEVNRLRTDRAVP